MMRGAASPRPKGFTILELLIAGSILAIALIGVYFAFDNTWATYSRGQGRAEVQQNGRVAMDQMTRQIRMAGYFPQNFPPPPALPPAPPVANPLHVATDSAFAFYGDADGSGASNVFLFCLTQNLSNPAQPTYQLLRVKTAAPAPAAAYTCAGGDILADFPAQNGTSLRFTYYDGNGTLLPTPLDGQVLGAVPTFAVTAQRAAARRVLITLSARRDVPGHQTQTYMLTSDVRLRNLVP
jgi:prepilin-type N-terminal cleavage/methylation domain-containing protein